MKVLSLLEIFPHKHNFYDCLVHHLDFRKILIKENKSLYGLESKKEAKQFKDQIFSILETTYKCLQEHDMDNLKVCLDSIQDLSNCEPKILRKNFNDIFILMGKIVEDKEADDNLREIAFEIIVALI